MSTRPEISAADYNGIRNKVLQILGNGSGTSGYGQNIISSPVFSGNTITLSQWTDLRNDIINIKLHQDGTVPTIASISIGPAIQLGPSHPNTQWSTILDQAFVDRFKIGNGRSVVSLGISQSRTGAWSVQSQCTATLTFGSAAQARYFFNSGGKLRFTSTRTGGSSTAQNNAWTNILNSVGVYQFSGNLSETNNFYTLTSSYATILNRTLSTPYSANFYRIEAKSNVANNSTGTATTIDFRVTWRDDYIDPDTVAGRPSETWIPPGDVVDGTLSIVIEEIKATGTLVPTGNFTISSPTYSITSISAS
jgi:hypothetical protein